MAKSLNNLLYLKRKNAKIIFLLLEEEVIDIETEDEENSENSSIEEIFENKNIEDTFNEQSSEINKNQQVKTRENLENDNNLEFKENRPPPTQLKMYQANFNDE